MRSNCIPGYLKNFLLLLIPFASFCQNQLNPIFSVVSNVNAYVTYSTTNVPPETLRFYLFGDGHYSMQNNPSHQFKHLPTPYTSKGFYLLPYDQNPPVTRIVTVQTQAPGVVVNPPYVLGTNPELNTSWFPSQNRENFYILTVQGNGSTTTSGCVRLYFNTGEVDVNTAGILEYNNWFSNRILFNQNTIPGYDKYYSWSYSNLLPNEQRLIYIPMYTKLTPGSKIHMGTANNINCVPNTSVNPKEYIVSAFPHDPNNKIGTQCLNGTNGEWVDYTINFENFGNGPAQNVVIVDNLSRLLNVETLTFTDAEYPYQYNLDGQKLTITFPDIQLPGLGDINYTYTHDQASSYIKFKIQTISNQSLQCIDNYAEIIFDNQPAIVTNTVLTCPPDLCNNGAGEADSRTNDIEGSNIIADLSKVIIAPNPSSDLIQLQNIYLDSDITIEIFNTSGKLMAEQRILKDEVPAVNVSSLSNGLYFMQISTSTEMKVIKFTKI